MKLWTRLTIGCLALLVISADRTTAASAEPMWVCATTDPVLGTQIEKYGIENGVLYNLSAEEILGVKGAEADQPDGKALNDTIMEVFKYRILEDNSVGLIAVQAEAKSYNNGNSVSADVLMIDKRTGGFRQLAFSQQLADINGKPNTDFAVRGECTFINDARQNK
jgi:hypothetical protein